MQNHIKRALPLLVLALIGLALGLETEKIHRNLASGSGYASFCNIDSVVQCDAVIGSKYSEIGSVSVSQLAILYYLGLIAVTAAVIWSKSVRLRQRLAALILLQAAGGVLFSVYMAYVAFVLLNKVCLMCSGLYLVALGVFATSWSLRRAVVSTSPKLAAAGAQRDRMILLGAAALAMILLVMIGVEILGARGVPATADEIKASDPKFFNWYKSQPITTVSTEPGNVRGGIAAPVTIVEFSDFGCGHCNAFHQSLEEVVPREGTNVRIIFRHFPLSSDCNPGVASRIHPDACLAAIAAECAGEQGKFWEYHNVLFDHQQELGREFLLKYAARLHLDVDRFTTCLASSAPRERVEHDAQMGLQLKIDSTPTLFINGRTIKGALDATDLGKALVLARDEAAASRQN